MIRARSTADPGARALPLARVLLGMAGIIGVAAALFATPDAVTRFALTPGRSLDPWDLDRLAALRLGSAVAGVTLIGVALGLRGLIEDRDGARRPALAAAPFLAVALILGFKGVLGAEHPLYLMATREDSLVEWLTFLAYAGAGVVAIAAGRRFFATGRPLEGTLYLGLALALFGVAGEEISWGQRIFGIVTPEPFAENLQSELNLHNLPGVQAGLHDAYIAVGLFGAFAWLLVPWADRMLPRGLASWIAPSWWLLGYFLPVAAIYLVFQLAPPAAISGRVYWGFFAMGDQEPAELLLALGFLGLTLTTRGRLLAEPVFRVASRRAVRRLSPAA